MKVLVLGSAAGGGVPQWNCDCANCASARDGGGVVARTQSSVAVSGDGRAWFLLNVSPDVRQQIAASAPLRPPAGRARGTPIAGCVLTDAELDHVAGLLILREGERFPVHATGAVRAWLVDRMPIASALAASCERPFLEMPAGDVIELGDGPSALRVRAFELGRRPPRWTGERDDVRGATVGLVVEDARGSRLVHAPALAGPSRDLDDALEGAACALVDGTFWDDDELIRHGSSKTARSIGHWPVGGADGSLAWLSDVVVPARVYVHVNNTNPMLDPGSRERAAVESAGITVGIDGWSLET